jgi:acetyl-CoA acetyltransferase
MNGSRLAGGPAAVVGIGHTDYSRGSGRSEWELANEAISRALADAEIDPARVDGLVRSAYENVDEAMVLRSFSAQLTFYSQINYGGMGLPAVLGHAAAAIHSGQASVVVCFRALNGYSQTRFGRAERSLGSSAETVARGDRAPSGAFAGPYGLLSPGQVMAMWLRRYQADYGVTDADMSVALGRVAVDQRAYANRNPDAIMRDRPLDLAGYLDARVVYEPLRLFDFALESDGAAALVVVSPDVARGCPHPPVWVRSAVQGMLRYAESISTYADLRNSSRYRAIARKVYERAGLEPSDISAAMLYDATTVTVLLALETYGFWAEGTAWRGLLDHGLGPGAPLPANTHGGHLSEAYVHFMNSLVEAVRLCRGTSYNQPGRDVCNVLCCSGPTAVILSV